jgi:hypothetical protein
MQLDAIAYRGKRDLVARLITVRGDHSSQHESNQRHDQVEYDDGAADAKNGGPPHD